MHFCNWPTTIFNSVYCWLNASIVLSGCLSHACQKQPQASFPDAQAAQSALLYVQLRYAVRVTENWRTVLVSYAAHEHPVDGDVAVARAQHSTSHPTAEYGATIDTRCVPAPFCF